MDITLKMTNINQKTLNRILKDVNIFQQMYVDNFDAYPDEDNMLIWYFLLRGVDDYENGWYIGTIILDPNYPFQPPNIQMLTPSGRYTIHDNICLSFTTYHKETWSPIITINAMVNGLYSNMNSDDKTEYGYGHIRDSVQERKKLADESIKYNLTYYNTIFLKFRRLINIDGTPKNNEEIKLINDETKIKNDIFLQQKK